MATLKILLAILLSSACVLTRHCNLPPSVWCSSREIARRCDVEKQCEPYLPRSSRRAAEASLVNFTLYYESLCPDCKNFMVEQLWPAFKAVGGIMNLVLIPYGNAEEYPHGSEWSFQCQHGEEECYGNLIETCAIHYHPNSSSFMPFVYCIESSASSPRNVAEECAMKSSFDYSRIKSCADGPLGNGLEHKMALKTNALEPPHQYVPWVTLNGLHTNAIQSQAQNDLIKLVCDTYQGGTKPQACSQKAESKTA